MVVGAAVGRTVFCVRWRHRGGREGEREREIDSPLTALATCSLLMRLFITAAKSQPVFGYGRVVKSGLGG